MSALQWVKNLFTKKENKSLNKSATKQNQKPFDRKLSIKRKVDELVVENISAQFFYLQGSGSGKYDCQDTYGMYNKFSQDFSFYAVFDGHGTSGKEASNSACEFMLGYIGKNHQKIIKSDDERDIEVMLHNMFLKADENLKTLGVDMDLSGTTCVCVLIKGTTLFVANTGDSRAVLGRISAQNRFAVELTQDHKPYVRRERERILKNGGQIRKITNKGETVGPFRIWADEDGPGLGLTRCIGNFASKKIGMICTPQVQKISLKETDQFVVIATDGLWEVMSSTDVVAFIVRLGEDRSQAAKQLVIEARNIWYEYNRVKKTEAKISDTPDVRYGIDDISAIIVFFNYEGVQFAYSTRAQGLPPVMNMDKGKTVTITIGGVSDLSKSSQNKEDHHEHDHHNEHKDHHGHHTHRDKRRSSKEDLHGHKRKSKKPEEGHIKKTGSQEKLEGFGPMVPDIIGRESGIKSQLDYRHITHSAEQQAELDKMQAALPNPIEKGAEYLEPGQIRMEKEDGERLIKNEYDNDFNVEADDDFIPEHVRNFQEYHNTSGFKGLGKTGDNLQGTQGMTSRGGKYQGKNFKPGGPGDLDSIDLLGDM